MFWLPGEQTHSCDKVYGATTRFELGYMLADYKNNRNMRFCVGSDGGFPELRTIKYDLSEDAPWVEVHTTLEATCAEAVKLAVRR